MGYQVQLLLWTGVSIALYGTVTWVAWFSQPDQHGQPRGQLGLVYARLSGSLAGRALLFFIRFAYYIGIPYLALLGHSLSLVVMGLLGTETADLPWWTLGWRLADWVGTLGWAAGLGAFTAGLLLAGWWSVGRALGGGVPAGGLHPAESLLLTARETLYSEIHWAFYRAAPLVLIADAYWAALAGMGIILIEWIIDPFWHAGLAGGSRREALLMQAVWLGLSTCLFVLTHNVWPILILHTALAWATGRWVKMLGPQPAASEA